MKREEKMFLGVCSNLANTQGMNVKLLRAMFIFGGLFSFGIVIALYLILYLLSD